MNEHNVVLSTKDIQLNSANTNYDLEFGISINPGGGQPSKETDYNKLTNKPSINNVTLQNNVTLLDLNLAAVYRHTTAEWNSYIDLVSQLNAIYIYTDFATDENDNPIPAIKIGDGMAYVVDLPFLATSLTQIVTEHINSTTIHTNLQEKAYWSNKVSVAVASQSPEELVFTN